MAGDWIKMRIDLQSHPKVVRILSATKSDKFRVIGGLHAVWSVFDTHSTDGRLCGYTPEVLDHIIGWDGFSNAMIAVGWLVVDGPETIVLPEFDEHNGQSGKRRAEDQKRKRNSRRDDQIVHKLSDETADKKRTESGLEKRREEKNIPPKPPRDATAFARFWSAYPKKVGKGKAEKAFGKVDAALLDAMLKAIALQSRSEQWLKDKGQFIPNPATWINEKRWLDEAPALVVASQVVRSVDEQVPSLANLPKKSGTPEAESMRLAALANLRRGAG